QHFVINLSFSGDSIKPSGRNRVHHSKPPHRSAIPHLRSALNRDKAFSMAFRLFKPPSMLHCDSSSPSSSSSSFAVVVLLAVSPPPWIFFILVANLPPLEKK
ncbi:unnamed protein product, partial [Brassica rapa subsp. narinosa]